MHHVLPTLHCAVWCSWVLAPLPTRSRAQCTGVATHLLTTTLFGAGVFLGTHCSTRELWPNLKCTQQNEVLGFSFSEESPSPFIVFLFSTAEGKLLFSVHNPNLNFANVRRCWFDLLRAKSSQNAPWRNAATRSDDAGSPCVNKKKEQNGLYAPPKLLLVNWINLWKLFRDPQTIRAQ